jgi:adenylosuccinate synthase
MPLDILVGAQWGDEGKGRIVDLMAAQADVVARFNGGDNAGHTVTVRDHIFKLHLLPSGLIHPHTLCVIGNGLVVNPQVLLSEMETLQKAGVVINPERLQVSLAAHLITPAHLALDAALEQARGEEKIGTTLRGIGPAYTDKVARRGLRMGQMLNLDTFLATLRAHIEETNIILQTLYLQPPLAAEPILEHYAEYARVISPYIRDSSATLTQALHDGKTILAEGAQGSLLDLDHGTYPYVTSSTTTAPGALIGLGLGVGCVGRVIGVAKSFQTRVGAGPFPTELDGDEATALRGTGENPWDEYGTTTGRPRRVGWLDLVLLRYAVRINGLTELILTKLDILSGLPTIKVCTAYRLQDHIVHDLALGPGSLSAFTPVYEELAGWQEDLRDVRSWDELPDAACDYILRIEELLGIPVRMVSVGPEREQWVDIA